MNGLFIAGIVLVLLAGLVRTVLFPKEINSYENRYAEKMPVFTFSAYLDGSYQDGVDAALSDQVNFSQTFKMAYNRISSAYIRAALDPVSSLCRDRYIDLTSIRIFNGTLVYSTRTLSVMIPALDEKAENYDRVIADHPELDFYVYYIEKDTDIDFETNGKVLAREYLFDRLTLPADHLGQFTVDSFPDFAARFYRTDHHWNCDGSYLGYTQLHTLLGIEDPVLCPQGDKIFVGRLSGSKAKGAAESFAEEFYAYRYSFPDMEVVRNGEAVRDYGSQEAFLSGQGAGRVSYGNFYGGDDGEIIFSTGRTDRRNLLILGESYGNAIVKLLASHYDHTYVVDLRYYEAYMNQEFRFSDYVQEHEIDQVLLIGNIDYFTMSEFLLEG